MPRIGSACFEEFKTNGYKLSVYNCTKYCNMVVFLYQSPAKKGILLMDFASELQYL